MKKYRLYDIYDFCGKPELLGEYDTMSEVKRACKERDMDTDGEWCPLLKELKADRYHDKDDWSY